jgi:hypothetical protein
MTTEQKWVLSVGTILFVLCGLFPPVKTSSSTLNLEHVFLFSGIYGYIDIVNLLIRWLIILVSCATAIYLLPSKKK